MGSHAELGPISQQYSAAATVPLIKSPSLWLPKPVELPADIHPLPEDITAYFVYPFTLEQHVLSLTPSPHDAIAQRRARNAELLHEREVREEQRAKEQMRKVAPGYDPSALLVPKSKSTQPQGSTSPSASASTSTAQSPTSASDPMDDLVSQLEQMDQARS